MIIKIMLGVRSNEIFIEFKLIKSVIFSYFALIAAVNKGRDQSSPGERVATLNKQYCLESQ